MSETPRLALPLLSGEQAQKHVTVNEALRALDTLAQLAAASRDLAAPPGSPADGESWIVGPSPTGAWAGRAGDIAVWADGAWAFHEPRAGFRAWVEDENILLIFDGAAWVELSAVIADLQNLALLGVGTIADAANPFAAKLNKALWTAKTAAEGGDGDLRYTLNKETAGDVLSFLLQRGFSGRAELGLIGDDDLTIKVSPNGSGWHDAIVVDKDTGEVSLPSTSLDASDSDPGIVELATFAETRDGVLDDRAVTPAALGAFAAFRAHKNAVAQTGLLNATNNVITWSTEVFDIGGYFDTSTGRWTPPAGPVILSASVRFNITNFVDQKRIAANIRKNGATPTGGASVILSGTAEKHSVVTTVIDEANGTDYYEVVVAPFMGAGLDITVDGDIGATIFCGARLR